MERLKRGFWSEAAVAKAYLGSGIERLEGFGDCQLPSGNSSKWWVFACALGSAACPVVAAAAAVDELREPTRISQLFSI